MLSECRGRINKVDYAWLLFQALHYAGDNANNMFYCFSSINVLLFSFMAAIKYIRTAQKQHDLTVPRRRGRQLLQLASSTGCIVSSAR